TSAHRAHVLARQQVEFVAGLTHELRTPLAAIRSAGQNLADGVVSDPDRVREYGTLLEREGRRLSGLIEDALMHAGIGSAPPAVLDEAIAACGPLAAEQDATLEKEIADDLPAVRGDHTSIRTLFENLLGNALKYGGRGGCVRVALTADAGNAVLSIRDQGPGI